jgi:hypothetical protein
MTRPPLTALEAEHILLLSHALARATAAYAMEPFSEQEGAMKKAERKLREVVYKLAGSREFPRGE